MCKKAALLLVILFASGCVCTQSRLPDVAYPTPAAAKKSLEYQIDWLVNMKGVAPEQLGYVAAGAGALARTFANDEFEKSGLFSGIVDVPLGGTFGEADMVLQIKILDQYRNRPWLNFLCGITLGLAPTYQTDTWTMTATVRRWNSGKMSDERTIVIEDKMNRWGELFLIFVTPFTPDRYEVTEATIRNMYKNLLSRLRDSGSL